MRSEGRRWTVVRFCVFDVEGGEGYSGGRVFDTKITSVKPDQTLVLNFFLLLFDAA